MLTHVIMISRICIIVSMHIMCKVRYIQAYSFRHLAIDGVIETPYNIQLRICVVEKVNFVGEV